MHNRLSWFSCGSSVMVELEFEVDGFCGGRKIGEPGGRPSEQNKNQQQTQPFKVEKLSAMHFAHPQ